MVQTALPARRIGAVAREVRRRLADQGDPARAAGMLRYFKAYESLSFYGLKTAEVRALVREIHGRVRKQWSVEDALEFCDQLIRVPQLEAKIVGVEVLGRYHRDFEFSVLKRVKRWLLAGYCANWATVDDLAPKVITPLLERFPRALGELRRWTASPNLWVRRAAVVALIGPARHGGHLDEAYQFVARLFGDKEDLMHKCTGWLLREAGRTAPGRLETFLLQHGPRIPRTTVRYAIERFPERDRKRILHDTR